MSRRFHVFVFLSLLLSAGSAPFAGGLTQSKVEKILADRIDKHERAIGLVAAVVGTDQLIVAAHGRMGVGDDRPVDGTTLFEVGSITKLFTGLLLTDMVERRKLGLEDPINAHLSSAARAPTKEGVPITLLQLANHTSGLPREPGNYEDAERYAPGSTYSTEQLFEWLGTVELERKPGDQREYSNAGFGLLGHLLALQAGQDYETLLRERITAPLGMRDTVIALSSDQEERFATGHLANGTPVEPYVLVGLEGARDVRSTANDMVRFVAANLGVLPTDLGPAMLRMQLGRREFGIPKPDRRIAWQIRQSFGSEVLYHSGKTWGFNSFIALDRLNRRGVVVLSNSQLSIQDIGWHLVNKKNKLIKF